MDQSSPPKALYLSNNIPTASPDTGRKYLLNIDKPHRHSCGERLTINAVSVRISAAATGLQKVLVQVYTAFLVASTAASGAYLFVHDYRLSMYIDIISVSWCCQSLCCIQCKAVSPVADATCSSAEQPRTRAEVQPYEAGDQSRVDR